MSTVQTRPRSFTYRTSIEWLGARNGRFAAPGRESLVISSPPEFKGEEGFWTPEDLFVGAVEMCLMLTFASYAEKNQLPVDAYYSEATGTLEMKDGKLRFTKIVVMPTIVIGDAAAQPKTLEILRKAEGDCLVANSITTEVLVEPKISVASA
jgi:peroxiredoxin-like protein